MRFSLKSLLLVSAWIAWCFGAIVGTHPWAILSFILFQYLLLAMSVATSFVADHKHRLFAICFAAGFLLWLLFFRNESMGVGTLNFKNTTLGLCFETLTSWVCNRSRYTDARSQIKHFRDIRAFLHSTAGTLFGILTYIGVWLFISKREKKSDVVNGSSQPT